MHWATSQSTLGDLGEILGKKLLLPRLLTGQVVHRQLRPSALLPQAPGLRTSTGHRGKLGWGTTPRTQGGAQPFGRPTSTSPFAARIRVEARSSALLAQVKKS